MTRARQLAEVSAPGAVIGVLVGLDIAKPGVFTPAAVLWLVGYPPPPG